MVQLGRGKSLYFIWGREQFNQTIFTEGSPLGRFGPLLFGEELKSQKHYLGILFVFILANMAQGNQ